MVNRLKEYKGVVFGVLVFLSLLAGGLTYTRRPRPQPVVIATPIPTATPTPLPAPTATSTPAPTPTPRPLRVYVSGEVRAPDVYLLPSGSIIKDAIRAAGGATEQANLDVVNQALELQDQQHIHIPAKSENLPTPPVVEGGVTPTPSAVGNPSPNANDAVNSPAGQKININTASPAELELLPGVGPTIARRIVDYRQANGAFSAIEDLMEVKGIGQATFDKLKDYVTVE